MRTHCVCNARDWTDGGLSSPAEKQTHSRWLSRRAKPRDGRNETCATLSLPHMENALRIRAATKPSIDEGLKDGMELVNPSGESRTEAQKRRAASQKYAALIAAS